MEIPALDDSNLPCSMDLNGQNRFFFYWTRRYGPDLVGGGW
jgi:hypothetical protein